MPTEELKIKITADTKEAKKVESALKDIGEADKKNAKQFDKTNKDLQSNLKKTGTEMNRLDAIAGKVGGIIAGAFAVGQLVDFGKELVRIRGEAQGVRQAFNELNRPQLLDELRNATKGTVSDLELMKKAVQARNLGVPVQKLGTFFEFARRRAKETGESVEFLTESIVTGIGRKSPLILDNLGISASKLSAEVKKTGDFGAAAAKIIEESLDGMGEDIDTTGEKTAQLSAKWDNFKLSLAESEGIITDTFDAAVEGAADFVDQLTAINDFSFDDILGSVSALVEALGLADTAFGSIVALQEATGTEAQKFFEDFQTKNEETQQVILANTKRRLIALRKEEVTASLARQAEIQLEAKALETFIGLVQTQNQNAKESQKTTEDNRNEIERLNEEISKTEEALLLQALAGEVNEETVAKLVRLQGRLASAQKEQVDAVREATPEIVKLEKDRSDEQEKSVKELQDAHIKAEGEKLKASKERAAEEEATEKKKQERIEAIQELGKQAAIQIAQAAQAAVLDTLRMRLEEEFAALEAFREAESEAIARQQDQLLITEEEARNAREESQKKFAQREAELKRRQAQQEKRIALFNIAVDTAAAIVKQLAQTPLPFGLPFIAILTALGAAQAGIVAATPIPKFAKGVIGFKGHGSDTSDSNIVAISNNESVMTAKETRQHRAELEAIRDGKFGDHVFAKYQLPIIEQLATGASKSTADQIADAIGLNMDFDDRRMVKKLNQGNNIAREQLSTLKGMKGSFDIRRLYN